MKNVAYYTLSPVALFLLWELLSRGGLIDSRFFPPPTQILHHLFTVSPEEGIFKDIAASLYRIFFGYLTGCLLGIAIGIAMGLSRLARNSFYPIVAMLYPLPKIAILPLIMLVFGIGDLSKIVVVAIGSFFLVLISTLNAVDHIPRIYFDLGKLNTIRRPSFIKNIILPACLPGIFNGLRLAIGYSLVIVVAAEFSGANEGIGYLIWQSWETFSIKSMYAGIFVIAFLGISFSLAIDLLERKFIHWKSRHLDSA